MGQSNDLFEELLKNGPTPGAFRRVLERMKDEGHDREVVRACVRGLEQDPDDIRLRRLLAHCYRDMGFSSLEETEISLAAEKIEKLIPIYKDQAQLFAKQGRTAEALSALRKYMAHYPGDEEALELLDGLEKTGPEPEAEAVPASQEAMPQTAEPERIFPEMATHTLAEIYVTHGQYQAAVETYEELLRQYPEDHKARERLRELKGGMDQEALTPESASGGSAGREKMISVLEGWLAGIQEFNRAPERTQVPPDSLEEQM
jgi:tetratricopeptide (TPR) repeat protein